MQWYLYALTLLFLPLSHGILANLGFLTLPKCDQKIISSIRANWEAVGRPQNVLKQMEEGGTFTTMYLTNDFYRLLFSCNSLKYVKGVMSATLLPKLGITPLTYNYTVEEGKDGVVHGRYMDNDSNKFRWNWYPVTFSDGVTMSYLCSDMKGISDTPLVYISVAKNHNKQLTKKVLKNGQDLLKGTGLSFKYNYNPKCFLDK